METEARARGLAGWARRRALGDSVSARRVAGQGRGARVAGRGSPLTNHYSPRTHF